MRCDTGSDCISKSAAKLNLSCSRPAIGESKAVWDADVEFLDHLCLTGNDDTAIRVSGIGLIGNKWSAAACLRRECPRISRRKANTTTPSRTCTCLMTTVLVSERIQFEASHRIEIKLTRALLVLGAETDVQVMKVSSVDKSVPSLRKNSCNRLHTLFLAAQSREKLEAQSHLWENVFVQIF